MGYYLRVFGRSDAVPSASELQGTADGVEWDVAIGCDPGREASWTALKLSHRDGRDIAFVTREGPDEVDDFLSALDGYQPRSGAEWVRDFLSQVRTVCRVKVQTDAEADPEGWSVMDWLVDCLASCSDGITHAEREGFYIDDGTYLVAAAPGFERLPLRGEWSFAVRRDGGWVGFRVDPNKDRYLGAFQRGEVPEGVRSWPV